MKARKALAISALWLGLTAAAAAAQEGDAAWVAPLAVQHALEGRAQCLMCHAGGIMEAPVVPTSHVDRPNDTCMWCHGPGADVQTTAPPAIPHPLEGRDKCLVCHFSEDAKDAPQVPASHAGRTEQFCALCHRPAAGG
jgi:hypothetical protein